MGLLDAANIKAPVRPSEAAAVTKGGETPAGALYGHFQRKLASLGGHSVSPLLKPENPDGSSVRDPYVAFRRRTERMQTRKHRQKDEQSCVPFPFFAGRSRAVACLGLTCGAAGSCTWSS